MIRFIKLTTVDPDTAEHVPSLYRLDQIIGCIQDGDRTYMNVGGDSITVVESVDQIERAILGLSPRQLDLN